MKKDQQMKDRTVSMVRKYMARWAATPGVKRPAMWEAVRLAAIEIDLDTHGFFSHEGTSSALTLNGQKADRVIGHVDAGLNVSAERVYLLLPAIMHALPSHLFIDFIQEYHGRGDVKVIECAVGEGGDLIEALQAMAKEGGEAKAAIARLISMGDNPPINDIHCAAKEVLEALDVYQVAASNVIHMSKAQR